MKRTNPGLTPGAQRSAGAAVVLLALLIIPAPMLPPLGLAGAVQSFLGFGWKTAYLVAAIGLQLAIYGSLGLVAAFSVGPGTTRWGRLWRLLTVPAAVVGMATVVRSIKLGHVPLLANAVAPMGACAMGVVAGLLYRQRGWRGPLIGTALLSGGLLWSFFPGSSSELSRETQLRLRGLIAAAPDLPAGEDRFGALLEAALAQAPPPPAGQGPIERNRAAILALGIAIGHERLARYAGLDPDGEPVRSAIGLRQGTTLRGREDWARHYCLSAALAVVENPLVSDAGGLIKEELDALTQGSGFSFGDLAADRAGVRFARAATGSDSAARAMRSRLQRGYDADDFFPPASDLPENLTVDQFRRDYGGVGTRRYRQAMRDIEARLDRCPGLVSP